MTDKKIVPTFTLHLQYEDGTPVEQIPLTSAMTAAIAEYLKGLEIYEPGESSTMVYEIPLLHLAEAVVRALDLPQPGSVQVVERVEQTLAGVPVFVRRPISMTQRIRIYLRDGGKCLKCGATEPLSIDHIVPVSKGGSDDDANLRTLCSPCNSSKGDRPDE